MFQVKPMNATDFQFAVELANTMDWNMAVADFQFMTALEPHGCFMLFEGQKRVGIATCINYGTVGWFGNLVVEQEYRGKGAGSLLVNHAVDYLHKKGVKTIGLYAFPNLVSFYGKLGFTPEEDFAVLRAQQLNPIDSQILPKIGEKEIQLIEFFDHRYFGGDRKKLLESIILEEGNSSYFQSEGGEVVGYVAATVYEKLAWLGPMVCREGKVDVAVLLVKAALARLAGRNVYAVIAKKEMALADMLFSAGFREDFSVTRMFSGETVRKNCIYLAESLERG